MNTRTLNLHGRKPHQSEGGEENTSCTGASAPQPNLQRHLQYTAGKGYKNLWEQE